MKILQFLRREKVFTAVLVAFSLMAWLESAYYDFSMWITGAGVVENLSYWGTEG